MEKLSQAKILESLTIDDYKNIKLPQDDFFDDKSVSSSDSDSEEKAESDNNKTKRYRFGENIYEKFSAYYFCETILNIDSRTIKFIKEVNINNLCIYNRTLPYFDENLIPILVSFCQKEKLNIKFNPDYIINNINGKQLLDGIGKCKENIHYFRNLIKEDKNYDLIGEVSIGYLTNPDERKFLQTKRYINLIKLFDEIKNTENIKEQAKVKFEELFSLVHQNDKILVVTSNGNYEDYLNNLKNSKIFEEDNLVCSPNQINLLANEKSSRSIQILKELKNSGINFIIVYAPRAYVNIKSKYSGVDSTEELKKKFDELSIIVSNLTEENKRLKNIEKEVERLTIENKNLNIEINHLKDEMKKMNEIKSPK